MATPLNFPTQNYIGTPLGNPTGLCLPPVDGVPKYTALYIDWAQYSVGDARQNGGVTCDINQGVTTPLDKIRSVYIDNTFSDVAIYVSFPDSKYTVVAPPGAIVCAPVVTNQFTVNVFGTGFTDDNLPNTNVFFLNVTLPGFVIPTAFDEETIFENTYNNATGLVNSSTNLWPNVPLGPEAADRKIVVAINWDYFGGSVSQLPLTVVTVGTTILEMDASQTGGDMQSVIFSGIVPAGNTAPILVSIQNAARYFTISVHAIRNWVSEEPIFILNEQGQTADYEMIPNSYAVVSGGVLDNAAPSQNIWDGATTTIQAEHVSTPPDEITLASGAFLSYITQTRAIGLRGTLTTPGTCGAVYY